MADSEEYVDFSIKLATSSENLAKGVVENIDLRCERGQALKIGRATKSEIAIMSPGISWTHTEIRILEKPDGEAEADGKLQLAIRDVSSNGTGVQHVGKELERLKKGEDTYLPHGAMVALPMRLKAAEDQRFFTVHIDGEEDIPCAAEAAGGPTVASGEAETAPRVVDIDSDSAADEIRVVAKPRSAEPEAEPEAVEVSNFESQRKGDNDRAPMKASAVAANGIAHQADEDAAADDDSNDEPASKRPRKSLPMPRPASEANTDDLPPARPPSGPPGARPMPRGARPKAGAAAPRAVASSDVPAILRDKIQAGEGIIWDARDAEDRNQWGQAFDCYQRGLAEFMQVLPKLGKDSPGGINLRQQINGYLTRAGELKEKLERSKAFGCRKLARPRGPGTA